jgi:ferritin
LPINRKKPSLDEMWRVIETFGIKRNIFEKSHPTEEDILKLFYFIKTSKRTRKDQETIRRLKEYVEKQKKSRKS